MNSFQEESFGCYSPQGRKPRAHDRNDGPGVFARQRLQSNDTFDLARVADGPSKANAMAKYLNL
jgi:hypothetical protein